MIFADLPKRFLISCVCLALLTLVLIFAHHPLVQWFLAGTMPLIGGIGIWEYGKLTKLNEKKGFLPLLIIFGVLVILSFFLSIVHAHFTLLPLAFLFIGFIFIFLYHFDKIEEAATTIAQGFFGICYVALPLGLFIRLLYLPGHQGWFWILYLIVVTKITDVGAYFGGKIMGNRKLAPQLSPGKTIAGAIVGLLCAIVSSLLFFIFGRFVEGFSLTLVDSLWLGALLGCLGQIGDLAESLLKRDAAVKDSNCLPGFGGILDLLDSLFFTIPTVYLFLRIGA